MRINILIYNSVLKCQHRREGGRGGGREGEGGEGGRGREVGREGVREVGRGD